MSTVFSSQRVAPAVAVALGVLTLGAGLSTVPLDSLIHQSGPGGPAADWLLTALVLVPAAALGTLLAARRPRNPLGWILLAIFLCPLHLLISTQPWTTGCTTGCCRSAGWP